MEPDKPGSTIPSAPTGLAVKSLEESRCTLAWDAVSDSGVKYIVYRKSNSDESSVDTVTSTEYSDTTIKIRRLYNYTVTAFNSLGESLSNNPFQLKTIPPEAPFGVMVKSVSKTSCIIVWNKVVGNGVTYKIIRDGIIMDTVADTEYHDMTLTAHKQYLYAVSACNAFGESEKINASVVYTTPEKPLPASPDGFVVWSEGDGCDRELKYMKLEKDKGPVGALKTVVNKGEGADIQVVISYDGAWIAFARAVNFFKGKYGECDYHAYDLFDVYIAKIDNGKNLPVFPTKIGHGYWPSWGDDANNPTKPRTLYYTNYSDQTIQKVTIQPDGSFSQPVVHAICPKKVLGTGAHTQMAPNGRYIAYRPGGMKIFDIQSGKHIPNTTAIRTGKHPSWGPKGNYLILAKNKVCIIKGDQLKNLGSAGLGAYHYGFSNDAEYNQGRLWIIGRIGGRGQNSGSQIEYKPVDISNDGWRVGSGIKVTDKGSLCDIHVYDKSTIIGPYGSLNSHTNKSTFITRIINNPHGLQLIIEPNGLTGSARLFDLHGKSRALVKLSKSSKTIIYLKGIANGKYILQLRSDKVTIQKNIWILK